MLTINRLDVEEARCLIAGARTRAEEIGVPMCIAITDESGNLVAFERMDGGKVTSITIAIDKSFTAAGARKATDEYGAASQPGGPAWGIGSAISGRLMVVAGGLPVVRDGEVLGGIGVSSGSPAQDREVATAGLQRLTAAWDAAGEGRLKTG
ncbi:MAG: heme-binding protein [Rhodobacteraceae bacterium]|nr:heme-binding protein [Paracoccaceae bacterium]MBR9819781.1 heme-binding protein [Paracoccaceae bacterium]